MALSCHSIYGQLNLDVAIFHCNALRIEGKTVLRNLDFIGVLEEPDDYLHRVYWEHYFQDDPIKNSGFCFLKNRKKFKKASEQSGLIANEIATYFKATTNPIRIIS